MHPVLSPLYPMGQVRLFRARRSTRCELSPHHSLAGSGLEPEASFERFKPEIALPIEFPGTVSFSGRWQGGPKYADQVPSSAAVNETALR